jgi:hypothetical protein
MCKRTVNEGPFLDAFRLLVNLLTVRHCDPVSLNLSDSCDIVVRTKAKFMSEKKARQYARKAAQNSIRRGQFMSPGDWSNFWVSCNFEQYHFRIYGSGRVRLISRP